jgi:hypothetical protein
VTERLSREAASSFGIDVDQIVLPGRAVLNS